MWSKGSPCTLLMGCKLVQPFWKKLWRLLKILNIILPYHCSLEVWFGFVLTPDDSMISCFAHNCYGLDTCSPKTHVLRALVASLWHYWEVVEPLDGEACWEKVRPLGTWPWRRLGALAPPCLSVSFCFLAAMRWTASSAMGSHHHVLPTSVPGATGPTDYSVSQNKPFLCWSWLAQVSLQ
jgi:hypothetical protein